MEPAEGGPGFGVGVVELNCAGEGFCGLLKGAALAARGAQLSPARGVVGLQQHAHLQRALRLHVAIFLAQGDSQLEVSAQTRWVAFDDLVEQFDAADGVFGAQGERCVDEVLALLRPQIRDFRGQRFVVGAWHSDVGGTLTYRAVHMVRPTALRPQPARFAAGLPEALPAWAHSG